LADGRVGARQRRQQIEACFINEHYRPPFLLGSFFLHQQNQLESSASSVARYASGFRRKRR
jgi:hypothetical protein